MPVCKILWILSLSAALSAPAWAEEAKVLEMDVRGQVQIAPDGHVIDYRLDSKLAPTVADLIGRNVRSWRFEPIIVDGAAVTAKTSMNLQLRAEPAAGKDSFTLRIANLRFGDLGRALQMKPPKYPGEAVRAHVGGKVLLAIRVDESGQVVEAIPRQTALDVRANSEEEAEHYRKVLERASVTAARQWRYDPGEVFNGKPIGQTALVPISYTLCDMPCGNRGDSSWRALLQGPVHEVPWMHKSAVEFDPAKLLDGQAVAMDSHVHLLNDVIGKSL